MTVCDLSKKNFSSSSQIERALRQFSFACITVLKFSNCLVLQYDFPFELLPEFPNLQSLFLDGNQFMGLDLLSFGGRSLPVQLLDLGDNKIDVICTCSFSDPDSICPLSKAFPQLQHLSLRKSPRMRTFPQCLRKLPNLRSLDFSEMKFSSSFDQLFQLTALTSLKLGSCGLSSIPEKLFGLTNLRELDLQQNAKTIQLDISNLHLLPSSLTRLNLSSNQIISSNLHPVLGLSNLRDLDLSRNRLTTVPPELFQCLRLETLGLRGNELHTLPKDMVACTSLQSLDLGCNRLEFLPAHLDRLQNLTCLCLDSNGMSDGSVPYELGFLANLRTLNLSDNNLYHIPFPFTPLQNLQNLYVSENYIVQVPPSIVLLHQKMKILDFHSNLLHDLPNWLFHLTALTTLDLRRNFLHHIPESVSQLTNLENLFLDCNALTCENAISREGVGKLTNLKSLTLDHNFIHEIPEFLTRETPKLFISHKLDVPSQIEPRLYLSGMLPAENSHLLKKLGVTHVLTAIRGIKPRWPSLCRYLTIHVDDIPSEQIHVHFLACFRYMHEALTSGGVCLVHCAQGVSRSATILIGYLMWRDKLPFSTVLKKVQKARPIVRPNPGFISQLQALEKSLRKQDDEWQ